jgi:hypothetical protein
MKKLKIAMVVLPVILATFLVSSCGVILVPENGVKEPGETETRQYNFSEFTRVDIGNAFEYEIQQADTYGISITANNNVFDDIKITQEGQTLIIGMEIPGAPWAIIKIYPRLKVVITMPQLDGLDSSGDTHGIVTSFSSTENMDVIVSGASSVELVKISTGGVAIDASGSSKATGDIDTKNMQLEVSGASTVQLEGSTDSMTANVSGSSNLKLADLEVGNASVTLSGASSGTINLDGSLDAKLRGSSRLAYIGEPVLGTIDITGASTLKRK